MNTTNGDPIHCRISASPRAAFYWYGLIYKFYHMLNNESDEITYPFPNFGSAAGDVWNGLVISFHTLWWVQLLTHTWIKVN